MASIVDKTKEYKNNSISEILESINSRKIFLPALQRKYVWKTEQIESFFDSLMQGYPIGTFLFWNVPLYKAKEYVFYEFIKNYHPRKSNNEKATINTSIENVTGVLDGQQRLTSLYLSLYGTYTEKIPGKWGNNPDAWQSKSLYLNLIPNIDEYDDFKYEFKFLTFEESLENDDSKIWYEVSRVIKWGKNISNNESKDYKDIKKANPDVKLDKETILDTLKLLHKRIFKDDYLTYFNLNNMDIDAVLDIFIRVNSGGTKLTKSDLLMSTITVSWDEARDKVDDLLDSINGNNFNFDIDFVMRTALVILDRPILFKVKSFNQDTVQQIEQEWDNISSAIKKTIGILRELGFNEKNLTSKNSIIPIVYYVYKGGNTKDKVRKEIKLYLQTALISKLFGSHGDHVLGKIRSELRELDENNIYVLKNKFFKFEDIKYINITGKSLNLTEDSIDAFLEEKKGRNAFVALTLLYPNWNFNETAFDQDHIFPSDSFENEKLLALGLTSNEIEEWQELKDQVPNLQILASRKNRVKNDVHFADWIKSKDNVYLSRNYIPTDISYEFNNFMEFFEKRKEILKKELILALNIK